MGRTLRLDVIAEGVESAGQLALLERIGCHAFQGYLFCGPVPVSELDQLLAADHGRLPARHDAPLGDLAIGA
jgi:EAL domain-containing protein (putative c-di-GMP-specific phosphodiesterase class I)